MILRRTGRFVCAGRGHEAFAVAVIFALFASGCTERLNAGSSRPHGILPVDERNPIVLANDGASDNWQGEYAMLLANAGGPKLAGIVVGASAAWPNINQNIASWRELVAAASASGLRDIPDPITSIGVPLARPANGDIDTTVANRSEGALFIVDASIRFSLPSRPLVVVTGSRLTDVADAYLVDPTVKDRIFVVSSLGTASASGGAMGVPNGEMDPWADTIVAARLRYVQVSAYYNQTMDVPASRLSELPANAFGAWIAAKQPRIWSLPEAADQVAVAAVGLPAFAIVVDRVSAVGAVGAGATAGPNLEMAPNGPVWLVSESSGAVATTRFWELLVDPKTYTR